jgi:hypothetical protein
LIKALTKIAQCVEFYNPDKSIKISSTMDGFVDDKTGGVNDQAREISMTKRELRDHLEKDAQSWEKLLFSSGGTLELKKCFYYLATWKWDVEGEATLETPEEQQGQGIDQLQMTSGNATTTTPITHLAPSKGHRTLGVRLALDGNMDMEFDFVKKKADKLATGLFASKISRFDARLAKGSSVKSSLSYSLVATTFTYDQCGKIDSLIRRALLAKTGFNRNLPKVIAHGPAILGGLNRMNVYTEQAVSKITFVLAQIRHQTQLGSQILIALQYDHLITGLSQPTLMDPTYVPHREESFFVVLPTFYGKMVSNYTFPQ